MWIKWHHMRQVNSYFYVEATILILPLDQQKQVQDPKAAKAPSFGTKTRKDKERIERDGIKKILFSLEK